ncbi:MAG: glutamine synthetase [Microbacteriaceae bacterium]|nr:MAG: glutamine synthetase [Microbacteriaceae bacterium]
MSTAEALPVHSTEEIAELRDQLAGEGVELVVGSICNSAGIALAKSVPLDRLGTFHAAGLGASPTWNVFCIDGIIAFTDSVGVVGDLRLRLDTDALRVLDGGTAWAPVEIFDQDGDPSPTCSRGLLRKVQSRLQVAGIQARVGHELEFTLTGADGAPFSRAHWTPYGFGPLLDHEAYVHDLLAAAEAAGLGIEQLHAEYARGQFEFSLPPASPLDAADAVMLARLLVSRVARRHGLLASFSPFPFVGGGGNGAHLHFSFTRGGNPLFSGGDGPHGITADGGAAIGGVIEALPHIEAVLTGSVLSGSRLQPGYWSGAFACWGMENREAAVRFLSAGDANPRGANVEVKSIDPSANPYLSSAAVLGAALRGITRGTPLPAEIDVNPLVLTDEQKAAAGVNLLASDQSEIIAAFAESQLAVELLGADIVDNVIAVRRHEIDAYGSSSAEELTEAFRFAWSI